MYDFLQGQVHPRITVDEMSIQSLSVLQFDEHGMALRGVQKAEGKLHGTIAELVFAGPGNVAIMGA